MMNVRSINYHNRHFRVLQNSASGESNGDTEFHYKHIGRIVFADYMGGSIQYGHLLGSVDEYGTLEFYYHQVNLAGELRCGHCTSRPEILADGRIRLHETWAWTHGATGAGESIVEELAP